MQDTFAGKYGEGGEGEEDTTGGYLDKVNSLGVHIRIMQVCICVYDPLWKKKGVWVFLLFF